MNYRKTFCPQKKETCLLARFLDEGWCLKPTVLQGFCTSFKVKKTVFGVRLILASPEPKTLYYTMCFDEFTRFVFVLQKYRKQLRGLGRWVKLGKESPVMVQIVQIITHPVAQMIEKRLYVKPPTQTKVYRCRP